MQAWPLKNPHLEISINVDVNGSRLGAEFTKPPPQMQWKALRSLRRVGLLKTQRYQLQQQKTKSGLLP